MEEISNITDLMETSVNTVFPEIFHKGFVYVSLSTPIKNTALFLIPLRDLYTNGVIVLANAKPVGRIGVRHVLEKILEEGHVKAMNLPSQYIM